MTVGKYHFYTCNACSTKFGFHAFLPSDIQKVRCPLGGCAGQDDAIFIIKDSPRLKVTDKYEPLNTSEYETSVD